MTTTSDLTQQIRALRDEIEELKGQLEQVKAATHPTVTHEEIRTRRLVIIDPDDDERIVAEATADDESGLATIRVQNPVGDRWISLDSMRTVHNEYGAQLYASLDGNGAFGIDASNDSRLKAGTRAGVLGRAVTWWHHAQEHGSIDKAGVLASWQAP